MTIKSSQLTLAVSLVLARAAFAQITGPSTLSTPYVLPTLPGYETLSLLTVDNTGATADDLVPKVDGGTYGMNGIPDGLGAFDNGDGTFTLLMNHELGSTVGVVRDHGAKGAYVSKWVISKSTLAVLSGEDLIKQVFQWNSTTQQSNTTTSVTGSAITLGGALGDIGSTVTFDNSSAFQELFQTFTPGAVLGFDVSLTQFVDGLTPDSFVVSILDQALSNITTDGIGNSLFHADITSTSPITITGENFSAGIGDYAGVVAVPEPATALFGMAIIMAAAFIRGTRREVAG